MKSVYILIISVTYAVLSPLIFDGASFPSSMESKSILASLLLGMAILIFEIVESKIKNCFKLTMLFIIDIYFLASIVYLTTHLSIVANTVFIFFYCGLHISFILLNKTGKQDSCVHKNVFNIMCALKKSYNQPALKNNKH